MTNSSIKKVNITAENKNVNVNNIYKENNYKINNEIKSLEGKSTGVNIDGSIELNGKYIDDAGKTFDAHYNYNTDGTYSIDYKDGIKEISIQFDNNGNKKESEVNYILPPNDNIKKVSIYTTNNHEETYTYKNDTLIKKEIKENNGTIKTINYENNIITNEITNYPDGKTIEKRYKNGVYALEIITSQDDNGNTITDTYDINNNHLTKIIKNINGITETRKYENNIISEITTTDGKTYIYSPDGLAKVKINNDEENLEINITNGNIYITGDRNISIKEYKYSNIDNYEVPASIDMDYQTAYDFNITFEATTNIHNNKSTIPIENINGTIKTINPAVAGDGIESYHIKTIDGQEKWISRYTDDFTINTDAVNNLLSTINNYYAGYEDTSTL